MDSVKGSLEKDKLSFGLGCLLSSVSDWSDTEVKMEDELTSDHSFETQLEATREDKKLTTTNLSCAVNSNNTQLEATREDKQLTTTSLCCAVNSNNTQLEATVEDQKLTTTSLSYAVNSNNTQPEAAKKEDSTSGLSDLIGSVPQLEAEMKKKEKGTSHTQPEDEQTSNIVCLVSTDIIKEDELTSGLSFDPQLEPHIVYLCLVLGPTGQSGRCCKVG